jgi:hypothetical protein
MFAGADDDGVQPESDSILCVGGQTLFPQRFGNYSEHGSAIEVVSAVAQDSKFEVSQGSSGAQELAMVGRLWRRHS